jgi:glycosyltransferase involved in cell wall biosynthesis
MSRNNVKKCRVLFVLPSLRHGGAETQVVDLLQRLDRKRFEACLFTFDKELGLSAKLAGLPLAHRNRPRRYKFDLFIVREIAEMIEANDVDVIHCTLEVALLMGWLGRRFSRRNPVLINAFHRTTARDMKQKVQERFVYQWPVRSCSKVICVCKSQEAFWKTRFPFLKGRTRVIYNGVDAEKFHPEKHADAGWELRKRLGISRQAAVITCVAGFRPEKNGYIRISQRLQSPSEAKKHCFHLIGA